MALSDKIAILTDVNNQASGLTYPYFDSWTFNDQPLLNIKTFGYYSKIENVVIPTSSSGNVVTYTNVAATDVGHISGYVIAGLLHTQISFDCAQGRFLIPIKTNCISYYTGQEHPRKLVKYEHLNFASAVPVDISASNYCLIQLYNILNGSNSYSKIQTILVDVNTDLYSATPNMYAKPGKINLGYYARLSESDTGGRLVIDLSGNFLSNVSYLGVLYTGADGIWVKTSTTKLYARLEDTDYGITYDINTSTSNISNANSYTQSQRVSYNSRPSTVVYPTWKDTSLRFTGYYTEAVGGTKIFDAGGAVISNISGYTGANGVWLKCEDITLYAHYEYYQIKLTINTYHFSYSTDPEHIPSRPANESHSDPTENPLNANISNSIITIYNTNLMSFSGNAVGLGTDLQRYVLNPFRDIKGMQFVGLYTNPGARRYDNPQAFSNKYNDWVDAPYHPELLDGQSVTPYCIMDASGNILRNVPGLTDGNGKWICIKDSTQQLYGVFACFLDNRYKMDYTFAINVTYNEENPIPDMKYSRYTPGIFGNCLDTEFSGNRDSWARSYFGDSSEYSSNLFWFKERVINQAYSFYADYYEGYLAFTKPPTKLVGNPFGSLRAKGSLRAITLPSSITELGNVALYDMVLLKEIRIKNPNINIASGAFAFCWAINTIYYEGTSDQWISLCQNKHIGGGYPTLYPTLDISVVCLGNLTTLRYLCQSGREIYRDFEWFGGN